MRIAFLRIPLRYIVYLLPVAFLVGRNVKVYDTPGRSIYIGASELLIVTGLLATAAVLVLRRRRIQIPSPVRFWFVTFSAVVLFSNLLSVLLGRWSDVPADATLQVIRWFEYGAVLPIVSVLITRPRHLRPIMLVSLVCMTASAAVTLYQAATFDFAESRPYGLVRSASDVEGLSVSNPNTAGALLMVGNLYLLAFAVVSKQRLTKMALFVSLLLGMGAMLFTLARSSLVGFLLGASALPLVMGRQLKSKLKAAIVVGLVVLFGLYLAGAAESIAARVINSLNLTSSSSEALSIVERFMKWKLTLQDWRSFFLLGVGFGRFQDYFGFVADNLYLELLATTGIVGLLSFFRLMFALGRSALQLKASLPFVTSFRAGYVASLIALLVASGTAGFLVSPRVSGLFWLMSAIMLKLSEWQHAEGPGMPSLAASSP